MSQEVMADAFAAFQEEYETTEAQGGAIERPDPGTYEAIVLGMSLREGTFTGKDSDTEIPCNEVQFRYQLVDDPSRETPLEWPGDTYRIAKSADGLPENLVKMRNINMGRLKGTLQTMLGEGATGQLAADIQQLNNLLDDENSEGVIIEIKVGKNKKGYYTENVLSCLSR